MQMDGYGLLQCVRGHEKGSKRGVGGTGSDMSCHSRFRFWRIHYMMRL
jgi:hypothetical protein